MMNIDQMAHEFVMNCIKNPTVSLSGKDIVKITSDAWVYADAMQAEADKRKPKGLPEVLFEPDWSQAPKWARWWAIDKDRLAFWHHTKPKNDDIEFYQCGEFCDAPSFNYQGNWKDSLRKRP